MKEFESGWKIIFIHMHSCTCCEFELQISAHYDLLYLKFNLTKIVRANTQNIDIDIDDK